MSHGNMQLVSTRYHVVRDVDGAVLLSTSDFRVAKLEQIDRFIHSMPCHIDISTWHKLPTIEEQFDAHHPYTCHPG